MNALEPQLLESLKQAIAIDAPVLAQLLNKTATAQLAVTLLGKALVNDSEAPLSDILATVQGHAEDTKLRVAAAEQQGQLRLRQSTGEESASLSRLDPAVAKALIEEQTKQEKIVYDDLANARQRQIELQDNTNRWLAYGVTLAFFVLIMLLFVFGDRFIIQEGVRNLLYTLLGVVATGWANIIGYYFGSSSGSQQKSQTLSTLLEKK
jgi:hypothetical protein